MIRYSIPLYKWFQFFFISLKREALICGNMVWSYASFIWFLHFLHLKFFFASSESKFLLLSRSIGLYRSPSRFDFPLDGFLLNFDFYILLSGRNFCRNLLRVLPVHWYHLFVSIYYHQKTIISRRNIIQSNENVIVQNTDLRYTKTNPDCIVNRGLSSCAANLYSAQLHFRYFV